MGRPRKFDHDEARRLYVDGETQHALARRFGVSQSAILRVVNPESRARMAAQSLENARRRREPCLGGCGRLVWRHGKQGRARSGYCIRCHGLRIAQTVRPKTLRCSRCEKWKRDDDFPLWPRAIARRGRASECRPCQTISRRERRHRNPEAARAYDRAYKAKVRAK